MRIAILVPDPAYPEPSRWTLIEPSLFLDHAPDGGAAFTRSILAHAQKATA